jgi:hypothetical protein
MEILRNALLVIHIVGLSMILGGVLVQSKLFRSGAKVLPAIRHGAYTQVATGILLVAVIKAADDDLNNVKIAVKLGVAVLVLVLALVNRNKVNPASWVVPTIGLLALANVVIAVFWH